MKVNVECVLYNLEQIELGKKPVSAKEELRARLTELTEGRDVPLVVFNCLKLEWLKQKKDEYPQAVVSFNPKLAACRYYQQDLEIIRLDLLTLGKPDLEVIIPDSELLDERVFSFAQSRQERFACALNSKIGLASELSELAPDEKPVLLWSEYCQKQGLKSPMDYTVENYQRIQRDSQLQKKVTNQVKDSKKFFEKDGIDLSAVKDSIIYDRIAWYLAMYMGEGQALRDNRAICLNLEDGRVPAWFQRGADGLLPILNPVDPNEFYAWRAKITGGQKM